MRPAVVLPLVLIAVAALLGALLVLGGDPEPAPPGAAGPAGATAPAQPRPADNSPSELAGDGQAERAPTAVEPVQRAAAAQRETVRGAEGGYANRVFGRITDPDGNPLAEARVLLEAGGPLGPRRLLSMTEPGSVDPPETWIATTEPDGRYELRSITPANDYVLTADHADWAAVERPIAVQAEGDVQQDVALTEGWVVHGYVMDNTGSPVVGARMELMPLMDAQLRPFDENAPREVTETDSTGRYSFRNVARGPRALTARAEGYGTKTAPNVQVPGQHKDKTIEQDFRLAPGVSMAGEVVTPGRQPIPGARVEVISANAEASSRAMTYTDERGRFRIDDLNVGLYTLLASADGWGNARENRVEAGRTDVRVELIEQGGVAGQVVDAGSGDPIESFTVALRPVNPHTSAPGRAMKRKAFRDRADGRYELGGADADRYLIEASAPGYAPTYSEPFDIQQGIVTPDVVVRLSTGGTIVGRLVDGDGAPIAGARVSTQDNGYVTNPFEQFFGGVMPRTTTDASARTGPDGAFELTLLTPEVYQIEAKHPNYTALVVEDVRVADTGSDTDLGTLTMTAGATVRGTVYDESGNPAAGAMVTLSGNLNQLGASYQARTSASGAYAIDHAAAGSYKLHAVVEDPGNPFGSLVHMQKSQVELSLYEGSEITQDLFLGGY